MNTSRQTDLIPTRSEVQAGYADFMFGAVKHFTDGGFLYASLGVAVGWASIEFSDHDSEI